MSTNQTPALARATEALCTADTSYWHHEQTDDYPCSSCVEKAQTAVSAALHDPDDPDWLIGVIAEALIPWTQPGAPKPGAGAASDVTDAVRAAILGEVA